MAARSWRWLRARIVGLLSMPPTYISDGKNLVPVPRTRIGFALNPPSSS